jgi:hypothetical protein
MVRIFFRESVYCRFMHTAVNGNTIRMSQLHHSRREEEVSPAQLGQCEFSRIDPLLAELEDDSLTLPTPALIAKMQAIVGAGG